MSEEQLKAFLEKVKGDLNLQERLKATKSQDEVVSIAKEHGHKFEAEHINQLSEEELEGVAGGAQWIEMRCMGVTKITGALCNANGK